MSDVVAANVALLGRPGFLTYNVGTGIETDVVALYRKIAAAAGSDLAPAFGPAQPGEQRRSVVDPGRLRDAVELAGPLSLEEGLPRTAKWFRVQAERAADGTGRTGD